MIKKIITLPLAALSALFCLQALADGPMTEQVQLVNRTNEALTIRVGINKAVLPNVNASTVLLPGENKLVSVKAIHEGNSYEEAYLTASEYPGKINYVYFGIATNGSYVTVTDYIGNAFRVKQDGVYIRICKSTEYDKCDRA